VTHRGPFQPRPFCDSVAPATSGPWRAAPASQVAREHLGDAAHGRKLGLGWKLLLLSCTAAIAGRLSEPLAPGVMAGAGAAPAKEGIPSCEGTPGLCCHRLPLSLLPTSKTRLRNPLWDCAQSQALLTLCKVPTASKKSAFKGKLFLPILQSTSANLNSS